MGSSEGWERFLGERLRVAEDEGRLEEELQILQFDYEYDEDFRNEDEHDEIERRLNLRPVDELHELRREVTEGHSLRDTRLSTLVDQMKSEVRAELQPEVRWARAKKRKEEFDEEVRRDALGPFGRIWHRVVDSSRQDRPFNVFIAALFGAFLGLVAALPLAFTLSAIGGYERGDNSLLLLGAIIGAIGLPILSRAWEGEGE